MTRRPFRLPRDARLVRFAASDGTELEGRLTVAGAARGLHGGVVLCHPHPLYGGSMLTPVILTAEQAFQEAGYTTLAFNFRGVGGSRGRHGEGRAEVADVSGALAHLAETLGEGLARRVVAGYSFGSVVGARLAASRSDVAWYLGIAPPLDRHDFGFLRAATCRIALVGGTRDELCSQSALEAFHASLPGTPWLRLLDTDHFFTDALDALGAACREAIAWADGGGS